MRERFARLLDWFRRDRLDAEFQDELQFHRQQLERDARAGGHDERQAREAARHQLGSPTRLTEAMRDQWSVRWLDHLQQDVRYALRGLRRTPGFTVAAIATLSLGIGANATMFGIVDRLLLRPPAHVADPGRLLTAAYLRTSQGQTSRQVVLSYPLYLDLRESDAFTGVTAWSGEAFVSGRGADAQLLRGTRVTANFFRTLGTRPALGRFFLPDEDGHPTAPNVVVVSHGYWRRALGATPTAIGQHLDLGSVPFEIVGVAPAGFTGLSASAVDVWVPMTAGVDAAQVARWTTERNTFWLRVAARLPEGGSRTVAASMATGAIRAGAERSGQWTADYAALDPSIELTSVLPREARRGSATARVALLLGGVSLVVLLIACANVANLQLARSIARRREIAVRLALGVSRKRLLGQLFTESLLLAMGGAIAALFIVRFGTTLVRGVLLGDAGGDPSIIDPQLLVFLVAAAMGAGVLSGLVPAIQSTSPSLTGALKEGARSGRVHHGRTRLTLLLAQTSISVVLLIAAGLFARSLSRLESVPLGMEPDRVLFASVVASRQADRDQRFAMYERLRETAQALPATQAAALATSLPFHSSWATSVSIPGRDSLPMPRDGGKYFNAVSADYFDVMGMRLLRGRGITDQDRAGSPPVVVVNETIARLWWPGEDPIGRCMRIDGDTRPCAAVVGIVADFRRQAIVEEPMVQFFVPLEQAPAWLDQPILVLRPRGDVSAAAEPIRRRLQAAVPEVPFIRVRPLQDLVSPEGRSWRLGATVFSAFGALALVVAALGLYSMLAYEVSQRMHELGLRRALGARLGDLLRLVVGQSVRVTAIGGMIGLVIALAAGPWIERLLFRTSVRELPILAAAIGVLVVAGIAAALVPAWRAARVDPVTALKAE